MAYTVRCAARKDLPRILDIYEYARSFMARSGNPTQWGTTEPPESQLQEDIRETTLFVVEDETGIHGVFYFWIGEDPTYSVIYEGAWNSTSQYGTIHRIAGDGSGGVLKTAVAYALTQIRHVRIDTHKDNLIMQKALEKQGFTYRGIIYIADGTPRMAYDLLT